MNMTYRSWQFTFAFTVVLLGLLIIGILLLPAASHLTVHFLAAGSTGPNVIVHNG